MKIILKSNAKINIGLNIVRQLENGYHSLDMTMIPIDLSDNLEIEIDGTIGELVIKTNKADIPVDRDNILYKIYQKFYDVAQLPSQKIDLFLEKNIPHQAGLGGGSSNGAVFLNFLNSYHSNILSEKELMNIGKSIGADIPFFIKNKPCRVTGIGENLEEIENNLNMNVVIIKPNFGVSTVEAYSNFKRLKNPKVSNIEEIITGLKRGNIEKIEKNISNMLEEGLLLTDKKIINIRKRLDEFGELKFYMSGSGSSFFGFLIKDKKELFSRIEREFKDCEVYLCNFK